MPKIAIALGAIILIVLSLASFGATRPVTYKVERSRTIDAPPKAVFAQVVDFHKWDAWSPWAKLDPNMKTTYEGEAGTVGSSCQWQGNEKIGRGKMTLVAVNPPGTLKIKLEFLKPYPRRMHRLKRHALSTSEAVFTFKAAGNGTNATWTINGNESLVGKACSQLMNLDKMIGADFENGLAHLDTVVAGEARKVAETAPAEKASEATAAAAAPNGSPTAAVRVQ
jgi:uncharacterized protein YndB with AHSA1/START domain